jgi:anti-sigma factor RsiW
LKGVAIVHCRDFDKRLEAYLDGALEPTIRNAFEEHIKTCGRCHDVLQQRWSLAGLLQNTVVPPLPEKLAKHILAGAEQFVREREKSTGLVFRLSPLSTFLSSPMKFPAAAALVLGLTLGLLMARDTLPHPSGGTTVNVTATQKNIAASFKLDSLTDSPSGSLPEAYISMMTKQGEGER